MKTVISIGNQDFVSIRKNHCFYIDKTDFIREWWENQDSVTPEKIWENFEYEYDRVFFLCKIFRHGAVF